ncbi:MAG: Hsp20/alpha crystallin family protein [Candidatus Eisenbacteria sp.]|nr:Hsp20/alpha crystallin family protein [Candidatus Eisenbacteria bacterium]
MTLVRWTPRTLSRSTQDREVPSPLNRWDTLFDEFLGLAPATSCDWVPALDVSEEAGDYKVRVDLPGISKDQVELSYENDVLTISGERKQQEERKEGKLHRSERFIGRFTRSLRFPGDVKPAGIDASFKDGVLEIMLPKADEARRRRIEVN